MRVDRFDAGRRAIFLGLGACFAQAGVAAGQPIPPRYPRSYERIIEAARKERALTIYSATDKREFGDVLDAFRKIYPFVTVRYEDLSAYEAYRRFIAEAGAKRIVADLVINSAMDLQIKLVNDGYTQPYASPEKPFLPDWAVWKNEAYAVSAEPIVFAYNKALMPAADVPKNHDDLQRLLEQRGASYRGKIALYNPETSSTGFLYVMQDIQLDRDTWNLLRAIGRTSPGTYISTDEMIRKIRSGEHVFAYNMIGSYALDMQARDRNFGVVLPQDYTLVASRIALIPRDAPHPAAAKLFLDFLLSRQGQSLLAKRFMTPLRSDMPQLAHMLDPSVVRAIRVGPALLVNQDQLKRANFFKQWRRAIGK